VPVARVAAVASGAAVFVIAEMVVHLAFEHAFDEPTGQFVDQAVVAEEIFRFIAMLE
jgi:hypothetical protein